MFVPGYSEQQAREAVAESFSYAATLRCLGLCSTGGNAALLKKWLDRWGIPTGHFDPDRGRDAALRRPLKPLHEVLVAGSSYSRKDVKRRLFAEGLKRCECELCGQGEMWRGRVMALILDHVNGVRDDHHLENLRIVCPNCAATLDTHCGRKNRMDRPERECAHCDGAFIPRYPTQRYCSRACGSRWDRRGKPITAARRVERL